MTLYFCIEIHIFIKTCDTHCKHHWWLLLREYARPVPFCSRKTIPVITKTNFVIIAHRGYNAKVFVEPESSAVRTKYFVSYILNYGWLQNSFSHPWLNEYTPYIKSRFPWFKCRSFSNFSLAKEEVFVASENRSLARKILKAKVWCFQHILHDSNAWVASPKI